MTYKQIYSYFGKRILSPGFLLLLIISLSIIPRYLKLTSQADYYTSLSTGSYLLHAKSIVFDHHLPLLGQVVGRVGGFAQGAGFYYFLGIPLYLMDGNPFSAKIFMFVISSLTVILCPLVFWRLDSKKEAIFIAIFLGISPYLNYHAIDLWPPHVVAFLIALYLISLYSLFVGHKKIHYLFMTFALGLVNHFEITAFALILPSYLVITIYLFYKKIINVKDIFLSGLIFLLLFLPHIIFDFSHNFYNFKGLISTFSLSHSKINSISIFNNILDRIHLFQVDLQTDFPPIPAKLMYFFIFVLIIGSYKYIKDRSIEKWKKIFIIHLFIIIALSFIAFSILPFSQANVWWISFHSVVYIFITGIILSYFWNQKPIIYKIFILLSILIFLRQEVANIYTTASKESTFKNQKYTIKIQEPVEYIYADSKNAPFKILYITKNEYVLDYKYMFWYIGKTKYSNSEGFKTLDLKYITPEGESIKLDKDAQFMNLSQGIYYLISNGNLIEKGQTFNFLEKPIGKLLSDKTLGNNYIVQKYYVK